MKSLITLSFLLVTAILFSQIEIKGSVLDSAGLLSGANVTIKHSKKGAFTDENGSFEIEVYPKDTLLISYLGYDSKEIIIEEERELEIILDGDINLKAVEIVAYGSHKCRTICCGYSVKCVHVAPSNPLGEKLYPNPSLNGKFNVQLINNYDDVQVDVFNISGQLMKSIYAKPFNYSIHLDLTELEKGIYIVNLNSQGRHIASKKAIIN